MCVADSGGDNAVFFVDPARLFTGICKGEEITGQGDMAASYSADRIDQGAIRAAFEWEGKLWVCTGMHTQGKITHELCAYRLISESLFEGEAVSYEARAKTIESCRAALEDPLGPYHGVRVKDRSQSFVLCGPPATFKPDKKIKAGEKNAVQLGLF
jgi:hypothetical protein